MAARDEKRRVAVGSAIDNRWRITKILGEGAFGAVYEVEDVEDPGKLYALKVESNAEDPKGPPKMLPLEVTVLRALRTIDARYYPGYASCGQNERFKYLVMGLVGKNIAALRKTMPNKRFSLRSCLHIGIRSILSLEEIHRAGFLHRDLKPANMCIGRAPHDLQSLYILDWGMCRKFMNEETGRPHRPRCRAAFRGSPRYASANSLCGGDQGRVDDMWSWFFCQIDHTNGWLPWDADANCPREVHGYIRWLGRKKTEVIQDVSSCCVGCPKEYGKIYETLQEMNFYSAPNYDAFIEPQRQVMARKNLTEQTPLDWEPKSESMLKAAGVSNASSLKTAR